MNKQQGFTLIELVMVIVILGILAATALPKFANLQSEARASSINAAAGAIKSAMAIVHAQSLIEGEEASASASVTLEGTAITTRYGYPTTASIDLAAGISIGASGDYQETPTGTFRLNNSTTCRVTYAQSAGANRAPTVTVATTGC